MIFSNGDMNLLDYQELVDDIKDVVYSPAMAEVTRLRDFANRYDKACDEVNDRLRRCASLLQRGLRDEAIGLSEDKPNLLELIAILDFPETPEWRLLLSESQLDVPSPIRIEIAEELNEAYALQQPLNELLKKHRLLAMSFSPLSERLTVLRQMRELDPNNLAWNDDQVVWEKARLKQISTEAKEAGRASDEPRLLSIVRELQSDKWCVKPEPELVERVTDMCRAVSRQAAMTQLQDRCSALLSAYNDGDDTRCKILYKQLKDISKSASVPFSDAVFARVRRILDGYLRSESQAELLSQQRIFIQQLDQEIQIGQSIENLEFRFATLTQLPLEVPDEVVERYRQALRRLKRAKTRRSILVVASSIAAFVVVSAIGVGILIAWQHNHRVGQAVAQVKDYLNKDKVDEAQQFVAQLETEHPAVLTSTRFRQILPQYEDSIRKEKQRKVEFASRLDALKLRSGQQIAIAKIESLEKSAKTAEEKKQVADLRQRRADDINARLGAELTNAEERFRKIVGSEPVDGQSLKELFDKLSKDGVFQSRTEASEDLQKKYSQLSEQMMQSIKTIDRAKGFEQEQAAFTEHIGDPHAYRTALTAFSAKYSDRDVAKIYERVAKEEGLWESMMAWTKLYQNAAFRDPKKLTPSVAKELRAQGKQLKEKHPITKLSEIFQSKDDYLAHIEARGTGEAPGVGSELSQMLTAPLMKDLYLATINYKPVSRVYVTVNPLLAQGQANRVIFDYVVGFAGEVRPKNVPRDKLQVEHAPTVCSQRKSFAGFATRRIWKRRCGSLPIAIF